MVHGNLIGISEILWKEIYIQYQLANVDFRHGFVVQKKYNTYIWYHIHSVLSDVCIGKNKQKIVSSYRAGVVLRVPNPIDNYLQVWVFLC